jgi:ribose 1,5-bisphosphokinase PhnN
MDLKVKEEVRGKRFEGRGLLLLSLEKEEDIHSRLERDRHFTFNQVDLLNLSNTCKQL